jgi:glutathione synthase/RimK-type ligase-like ATP-grasp enzyme
VPRHCVVGNPDNRRVHLFAAAVARAGRPAPRVVPWRDVAAGRPMAFGPDESVRIDSPGEDAEVDRSLRGATEPAEPGQIVGQAAWYLGFAAALHRVAAAAREGGARLLTDPTEVLVMTDKRACHARLARAGVAVPPALASVSSYAQLRRAMTEAGWSRVFVKPAYGSSASGVLALAVRGAAVRATTSVELVRAGRTVRLFNSLRVRDYHDERDVAAIVDTLAPDGLHIERWFPKAGLSGRVVDVRVVVIGGRPTHAVVRSSRSPMTNLHLGGARGDLEALRRAAGQQFDAAMTTCAAAAACFPGSSQVGIDLMFSSDWRRHAVAEVNAFGDLLPGLLVDGRDTYDEQVATYHEQVPA